MEVIHHRGDSSRKAVMAVITLKLTWIVASRFAAAVAPIAASTTIKVEPTLAPITRAAPSMGVTNPWAEAVRTTAREAVEDCIKAVNTAPARTAVMRSQMVPAPSLATGNKIGRAHV